MSRPVPWRSRTRLRRIAVVLPLALALGAPTALAAQAAGGAPARAKSPGGWTTVRVAKWALLGAAAALGAYALAHSTRAEHAYGDLRHLCVADPAGCALQDGRYDAPRAEALYQTSLREDRRARAGIVGGQVALLGSAALFVYDLRNGRGPENLPYPGAALRPAAPRPAVVAGAALRF